MFYIDTSLDAMEERLPEVKVCFKDMIKELEKKQNEHVYCQH